MVIDSPQTAQLTVNGGPIGVTQVFRPKVRTGDNLHETLEVLLGLLRTLVSVPITNVPQALVRVWMKQIYGLSWQWLRHRYPNSES